MHVVETMPTTIDADKIDSTFQAVNDDAKPTPHNVTEVFEGTHVYDPESAAATRTYSIEHYDGERERLSIYAMYQIGGEEVNATEDTFELTDDGEHVEHSGETIEEFCRSNHYSDPQLDIEHAIGS